MQNQQTAAEFPSETDQYNFVAQRLEFMTNSIVRQM